MVRLRVPHRVGFGGPLPAFLTSAHIPADTLSCVKALSRPIVLDLMFPASAQLSALRAHNMHSDLLYSTVINPNDPSSALDRILSGSGLDSIPLVFLDTSIQKGSSLSRPTGSEAPENTLRKALKELPLLADDYEISSMGIRVSASITREELEEMAGPLDSKLAAIRVPANPWCLEGLQVVKEYAAPRGIAVFAEQVMEWTDPIDCVQAAQPKGAFAFRTLVSHEEEQWTIFENFRKALKEACDLEVQLTKIVSDLSTLKNSEYLRWGHDTMRNLDDRCNFTKWSRWKLHVLNPMLSGALQEASESNLGPDVDSWVKKYREAMRRLVAATDTVAENYSAARSQDMVKELDSEEKELSTLSLEGKCVAIVLAAGADCALVNGPIEQVDIEKSIAVAESLNAQQLVEKMLDFGKKDIWWKYDKPAPKPMSEPRARKDGPRIKV